MNNHVNKKRSGQVAEVLDLSTYDPGLDELGLPLHGKFYIKANSDCHTCNRYRMVRVAGGQPKMCPCAFGRYLKKVGDVLMELNRQMAGKKFKDDAERSAERDRLLPIIRKGLGF